MSRESPIEVLERWEGSGASWKVVLLAEDTVVIDLCTCYGEPVERLEATDPETIEYVRVRQGG